MSLALSKAPEEACRIPSSVGLDMVMVLYWNIPYDMRDSSISCDGFQRMKQMTRICIISSFKEMNITIISATPSTTIEFLVLSPMKFNVSVILPQQSWL
jgi:hypothetical protein